MSERTAHRILAGQIKPVRGVTARLLRERDSSSHAPAPVDLAKDRRGLRIAKDDMAQFSRAVERDLMTLPPGTISTFAATQRFAFRVSESP